MTKKDSSTTIGMTACSEAPKALLLVVGQAFGMKPIFTIGTTLRRLIQ